jgi:hypothetical protein
MLKGKTYNQRIYGYLVSPVVEDNVHDFAFVCNKMGNLYQEIDDPCTDNPRVCKLVNDKLTEDYVITRDSGCCGSIDMVVVNPKTGNKFSIGFNFGH